MKKYRFIENPRVVKTVTKNHKPLDFIGKPWICGLFFQASDGTRTRDLLITNQSLYQLSHRSLTTYERLSVIKTRYPLFHTAELHYTGF